MSNTSVLSMTSRRAGAIKGDVTVPGDKSISHRALILSSQAIGQSRITGLLEGEDVLNTAKALQKLGVPIEKQGDEWVVNGVGTGGLSAPDGELDVGNSGTGVRLLMGLVAPYNFPVTFTGDASLSRRPMRRVTDPLSQMGVSVSLREETFLPATIQGNDGVCPIRYALPMPSAQVKSAILLAALNIPGEMVVIEPELTRDHTELMLKGMGAELSSMLTPEGNVISLKGWPELTACDIAVPGDPSSAAFLVVAALIIPGSELVVKNICMNPLRTGLYETLQEMGGDIAFINERIVAGEKVADIRVKHSVLRGVEVPEERAPSMIDEYPILSIAASVAEGATVMKGLQELRVKESDRLSAVAEGLKACGVKVQETEDTLTVRGIAGAVTGGGLVKTHMDHRMAMSFLIMGMVSERPVTVDDAGMIATSFPVFIELMNNLGADIASAAEAA